MNIAFLGLGNMGMPMAENLYAAGFPLTVYNRSMEKARLFASGKTGIDVAATPAEAAMRADIIITMVADDHALQEVVEGKNGICKQRKKMWCISR